jgi:hypothetical protein
MQQATAPSKRTASASRSWRAAILSRAWPRLDQRGATSLVVAASATALLGFSALATEGGTWYVTRRAAQNAADASALAGALSLAFAAPADREAGAQEAARDVSARNGFPHGGTDSVLISYPPGATAGAFTGNTAAVEVQVTRQQTLSLASLFVEDAPVIGARAVALLEGSGNACILGLDGGVAMGGNSFVGGAGCVVASNARGKTAISISGSAEVQAYSLSSVGGCGPQPNCSDTRYVALTKPFAEYQLPTSNPYEALDSKTFSPTCLASTPSSGTIAPTGLTRAYCSGISLNGNRTLSFSPGTYVFKDASINFQSGTVQCVGCTGGSGVTIILTGTAPSTIGTLTINANSNVTLTAPTVNSDDPDFNGVLFFRDSRAIQNSEVQMNGNAGTSLRGALYFPSSLVKFNGNATLNPSDCTVIVGRTVDVSGSSETRVAVGGCANYGTTVPQTQFVRLVL